MTCDWISQHRGVAGTPCHTLSTKRVTTKGQRSGLPISRDYCDHHAKMLIDALRGEFQISDCNRRPVAQS